MVGIVLRPSQSLPTVPVDVIQVLKDDEIAFPQLSAAFYFFRREFAGWRRFKIAAVEVWRSPARLYSRFLDDINDSKGWVKAAKPAAQLPHQSRFVPSMIPAFHAAGHQAHDDQGHD